MTSRLIRKMALRLRQPAAASSSGTRTASSPLPIQAAHCSSSSSSGDGGALPRIDAVRDVASTRWLKLQTLNYTDETGTARTWDLASRTTKSATAAADAVVILALLRGRQDDATVETLVVEQFRPPMGRTTVELPAGLIDDGETAEAAALRELREETGFIGDVVSSSMEVCMSPGICDETVRVVVVDVDLARPENQHPKQALDEGEYVLAKRVPLAELRRLLDQGKMMPIEGLYLLALGLELGATTSAGAARSRL